MSRTGNAYFAPRWSWLLDFGDPCQAIDLSDGVRARVRAQQVLAVTRMTPALMLANVVNAFALLIVLYVSSQLSTSAAVWAFLVVGLALWTLWLAQHRRPSPFPATMRPETCHKVVRNAALFGVLWAIPGVYFLPVASGTAQAFVTALLTGMICGAALALHPIPAAAIVFLVAVTAGGLFGLARTGDPTLIGFILIALAFFFVVSRNILRHSEVFVSEFVGKLELEEKNRLVARLLDETRSAASEEKRRSERRFAQAQKMEAIGQLTGGVAHDFNNLLAGIQGHAELIALEGKADASLVAPIIAATERGSDLVRRLLSVARKQALKPETVDVGQLIDGMTPLLSRTLGSGTWIKTRVEPTIWNARADLGELESAILNLVLNARDAMPRGGRLEIDCSNARAATIGALRRLGVRSGEFVQIAVRDSGNGMTAEVCERALEPFFTTKKFGEGSGLGLSTAFGFVRQSGGYLAIESQPGAGTTVRLFLPRSTIEPPAPRLATPETELAMGAGETILVVEDDVDVRTSVAGILSTLRYRVLSAPDAAEALRVIGSEGGIDLVLTDVVLPGGISGVDLAERLAAEGRPAPPVAFMSGNPDGYRAEEAPPSTGRPLLAKPFLRHELAECVGGALREANGRQRPAQ